MKVFWPLALVASACSLTSSLDDLRGTPSASDAGSDAGAPEASTGGSAGAGGSSGGASGSGGAAGSAGSGGGDGSPWPDAAHPCASQAKCSACCASSHPTGQQEFVATIKKCVCQDPNCATDCSTYCGGGQISPQCSQCVTTQSVQSCIGTECSSSDCKAYTDCVSQC